MSWVLLSIACSVLVSVLLKLAGRIGFDVGQAIAWNYVVAGALTALLLHPTGAALRGPDVPWSALAALGILLPTIFLVLAAAIRHAGIVRSDAAQRLSLVLSLLAAFTLFGEQATAPKLAGIALGLAALLAMVWRHAGSAAPRGTGAWLYPVLVCAGFGTIDVLFKRVAAAGIPLGTALAAMFALALVVAFGIELTRRARGAARFTARSLVAGVVLGAFNFGNILFYLRGHQALPEHPALVFTSMNLGVVALGALVGLAVFRERLSRINLAGVVLALAAIPLLAAG